MLGRGTVQEGQAVAVGDDEQVVRDLALGGGHVGIDFGIHHGHVLHMPGVGRVGHIQDLHAVAEDAASVEVILAVLGLVQLGLEKVVVVAVVVGEDLHIFDVALVVGTLGIKRCHGQSLLFVIKSGINYRYLDNFIITSQSRFDKYEIRGLLITELLLIKNRFGIYIFEHCAL